MSHKKDVLPHSFTQAAQISKPDTNSALPSYFLHHSKRLNFWNIESFRQYTQYFSIIAIQCYGWQITPVLYNLPLPYQILVLGNLSKIAR